MPCMLGANGVERIFELNLNQQEREAFEKSIEHVRQLCKQVDEILSDAN